MDTVNWLLAGAGDIAHRRVAPALAGAGGSALAAVCDPNRERADALAARLGVAEVYYDYAEALARTRADAVYVATPHHLHVDMSLRALAADKHLLCEKPLGLHGAECLELLDAARRGRRVASCSNYRLFTRQFQTALRLIREGALGRLVGGWAHYEEPYYNPGQSRLLKSLGMSPALQYGFYLINTVQILMGMPSGVFARMASFNAARRSDYDIEDLETFLLCYPGGEQFSITINNVAEAPVRHAWSFYGEKGRLHCPECPPQFNAPVELATPAHNGPVADSQTPSESGARPNWHFPMIEDFVRAVRTGTPPRCTVESAARTAVITDALEKSAATGRLEPVAWEERT